MSNVLAYGSLMLILCIRSVTVGQTYFVDPTSGDDAKDGLTELTAWRSLEKVNTTTFQPGDSILLKRGEIWSGYLHPLGSGIPGHPIIVGSYGTGPLPQINTGGSYPTAVLLLNQEYWEIENLEVTNQHPTNSTSSRYGIYVISNNYGVIHHVMLRNLAVHDVNGNPGSKTCGGIFFEVMGGTPGWFDSVIVEGCDVHDVSPIGIANTSNFATRTMTTNTNWLPSVNVFIRNNAIRRTVRNGVIIRVAHRPIIEHNVLQECAIDSSGNALFVFNCDSAIIQYNEALLTRFGPGEEDAGGFDGDYRCKKTIIQYNYSHHNDYGGIVVVSDGGGTNTFNDSAVVRYNVLAENRNHSIRISGNVTNATLYNNTIYSSAAAGAVVAIWHKSWGGYCDNTRYNNNIFELQRFGSSYQLNGSTNNVFDYNIFHGIRAAGEPSDPHKITSDPMFVAPDSLGNGWLTAAGLRLKAASPAIDSGIILVGHSTVDYSGGLVPYGSAVDRGAFEYQDLTGVAPGRNAPSPCFSLNEAYPNPFNPTTSISFSLSRAEHVALTIADAIGRVLVTLVNHRLESGSHTVMFDASHYSSGMFFYTLRAGGFSQTKRLVLIK